jgi:hypothetical protein
MAMEPAPDLSGPTSRSDLERSDRTRADPEAGRGVSSSPAHPATVEREAQACALPPDRDP